MSLEISHKSKRNQEDSAAPMGMGATNSEGRLAASILKEGPAQPEFKPSVDVVNGGVMLAVPALVHCGLLSHIDKHFKLPDGYYGVSSILLTLAFSALARIASIEQLRYEPPGEWGKLLGLDRIPEVKTLREKIEVLAQDNQAKAWSVDLSNDWLNTLPAGTSALYIDGHVRVYSGEKFNIPKHFVPRIKLCLRAACDYWVNAMDGQPFFMVSQAVDPGLIQTLENVIVPSLENTVPHQPSQEQLEKNPYMSRFTVVFDREGYSPQFMLRLWQKRIASKTYAKHPGDDWPIEEFTEHCIQLPGGETTVVQLAERGTRLIPRGKASKDEDVESIPIIKDAWEEKPPEYKAESKKMHQQEENNDDKQEELEGGSRDKGGKKEMLWVREVRKLNNDNSQTTIYATEYHTSTAQVAIGMFARWCQENFFKYMRKHYGIDDLIAYSAQDCPDEVQVVNPVYRDLSGKLRKLNATRSRRIVQLRDSEIPNVDPEKMEKALEKKMALRKEIDVLEEKILQLKQVRKNIKRHILAKDLSDEDKLKFLTNPSKQLIDTIKIICYRAETAMALELKEHMSRGTDDVRSLLQGIYKNEADLIPNIAEKTLIVRLHHLANHSLSKSIQHLCNELNATETIFPGTDLRLIYEMIN